MSSGTEINDVWSQQLFDHTFQHTRVLVLKPYSEGTALVSLNNSLIQLINTVAVKISKVLVPTSYESMDI